MAWARPARLKGPEAAIRDETGKAILDDDREPGIGAIR